MDASSDPPPAAHDWDRLLQSVSPASLLVVIQGWLGPKVARWCTAEDVWQETLLHAWRDRDRMPRSSPREFRTWLCAIARHRVLEMLDQATAQKRGGGDERRYADVVGEISTGSLYAGPVATTTPSRALADRERAEALLAALSQVPDEWREVVRLRLFEDLALEQVAQRLAIGAEAARYRFRRGLEVYLHQLRAHAPASSQRGNDNGPAP
ncbi:MAG: sigma-70 family RNA polymerase sigma factor [Planctomycetota bacterium]